MNRKLSLVVMVVLGVLVFGFLGLGEGYKFGMIVLQFNDPFMITMKDAAAAKAEELGCTLTAIDGQADLNVQISAMENLIAKGVDAIILNPIDAVALVPVVKEANAAGIPVFTIDTTVSGGEVVSAIHSDNVMAGVLGGIYIVEQLRGEGQVAMLNYPAASSCAERERGLRAILDLYPGIEIVAVQLAGVPPDPIDTVKNILTAHPEVDVVFTINDPNALCAVTAIEEMGMSDQVFVVSVDALDEAIDAMKAGAPLGATAAQQPALMATLAVEYAVAYLNGESVPEEVLVPVKLIRQEDLLEQ